jgi:hypothetical protein
MALGLATRRSREGESVSEATALIEGDDGREGLGGHRLDAKPLRCFARTPTRLAAPATRVWKGDGDPRRRLQRIIGRACPTRLRWLGQADDLLRAKTLQRPWLFGRRSLQRNQSHLAVEDRNTALRRHRIRSPNHAVLVRRPTKTDLADTRKDGRHRSRFGMHRLQCRSRHTVVRT